jgi:hypothetical protein
MKRILTLFCALWVAGCQSSNPLSGESDPKSEWWELAFTEPDYMKVWVEDSSVQDITGKVYFRAGGGSAAGGEPDNGKETARGWTAVGGSGKRVVGADLPERIYVRWQSIAEQKTWQAWVDIPEEARQIMVTSTTRRCPDTPEKTARFMASVYLGLPPGGVVQVWVRDPFRPIAVTTLKNQWQFNILIVLSD